MSEKLTVENVEKVKAAKERIKQAGGVKTVKEFEEKTGGSLREKVRRNIKAKAGLPT